MKNKKDKISLFKQNNGPVILLKECRGFSLIEILIALLLASMLLTMVVSKPVTDRQFLERTIDKVERSIRFAVDEAALRNVITRVHLKMQEEPQEIVVEFGPSDNFVLPPRGEESTVQSLAEEEEEQKQIEELNSKFQKVNELQDDKIEVDYSVRILGMALPGQKELSSLQSAAVYVYPSGEKDSAIIIFATSEEVVSLEVGPFGPIFERQYKLIEGEYDSQEELEERQFEIAKELFETWAKKF